MKYAECNNNEKVMWRVVVDNANVLIGGYENTMMDFPEDTDEYKDAVEQLKDTEGCIEYVKSEVFSSFEWRKMDNLHFVTREWVEERCRRITKKILRETREYLGIEVNE